MMKIAAFSNYKKKKKPLSSMEMRTIYQMMILMSIIRTIINCLTFSLMQKIQMKNKLIKQNNRLDSLVLGNHFKILMITMQIFKKMLNQKRTKILKMHQINYLIQMKISNSKGSGTLHKQSMIELMLCLKTLLMITM